MTRRPLCTLPFCRRCDSAPAVTTEADDVGPGLCVDCERLAYERAHDQWIGRASPGARREPGAGG